MCGWTRNLRYGDYEGVDMFGYGLNGYEHVDGRV